MTGSGINQDDPGLGLVAANSYLYYEPYADNDSKVFVYRSDGSGANPQYHPGWSGSLRPNHEPDVLTPYDTIYKFTFERIEGVPGGDLCYVRVDNRYPINENYCPTD